jgi:hypothetical protein
VGYFCNFQFSIFSFKTNNHQLGENSPNLVALVTNNSFGAELKCSFTYKQSLYPGIRKMNPFVLPVGSSGNVSACGVMGREIESRFKSMQT